MRIYRAVIAVAVLAAAIPSYALAQVESTPIPAPEKPNFSSMSFMLGTWTCSTKSARRPAPYAMTSTYTLDPSGWWINETSSTSPTKWIASEAYDHRQDHLRFRHAPLGRRYRRSAKRLRPLRSRKDGMAIKCRGTTCLSRRPPTSRVRPITRSPKSAAQR